MHHYQNKRDNPGDYFPMPKAAFRLGLDSGEIAVLAFLMYCEDRKTYQCHPSYSTIRYEQQHRQEIRGQAGA